jgi:hypothetical protein
MLARGTDLERRRWANIGIGAAAAAADVAIHTVPVETGTHENTGGLMVRRGLPIPH